MKFPITCIIILLASILVFSATGEDQLRVSAPLLSDSPGKIAGITNTSVLRIECQATNTSGSGFLHKSGRVITVAHVVDSCPDSELIIIDRNGNRIKGKNKIIDPSFDLALITPEKMLSDQPLNISMLDSLTVGAQVSAWGFPDGYFGLTPLLTVGYLAGIDYVKTSESELVKRAVVNAAFNSGNSGGPVVDVETGDVIGVVVTKLAPIPKVVEDELDYLKNFNSGIMAGSITLPNGTKKTVMQGQVIADVLYFLRRQTQLVIGHSVLLGDLRDFLKRNHIEP